MTNDPRYPLHIRIIGIMYKDNSKLYMAFVLWSDKSEVMVYRSLWDFRQFHRRLKRTFPVEPFHGRVLPRFGGLMMKLNFQRKTPDRCMHRMKALERYCTELLRCEPRISQSTDLIQFFLPKEQELNPEFVLHSVMIFQSNDDNAWSGMDLTNKHFGVGNVTQPFVTKMYRCVAPYETKDTKNRPFKVAGDETVAVLMKDQAGWWLVENDEKHLAWFPAPYLELCEDEDEEENDLHTTQDQTSLYCAGRNYTSESKDELSVSIGAIVEVLQKSDTGWWFARYNGKTGFVPSIYLHPYTNPVSGLQKKLHGSILNLSNLQNHLSYTNQNSKSVATLSKQVDHSESISCKSSCSDDTAFSFSSSTSLGLSLYGFEGVENLAEPEKDLECDGDMAAESPTGSESSSSTNLYPRVPPRPLTQEILSRCTTYTRKAALAKQVHLFSERTKKTAKSAAS